jgi:heat-inducible transcriptional repressor
MRMRLYLVGVFLLFAGIAAMALGGDNRDFDVQFVVMTIVVIAVAESGRTQHALAALPSRVTVPQCRHLTQALNQRLAGRPLSEITREEVAAAISAARLDRDAGATADVIYGAVADMAQDRICVGGTAHILEQFEFADVAKARRLMHVFEDRVPLRRILMRLPAGEVSVAIGAETPDPALADCALVAARCTVESRVAGVVAVLGPKRMPYDRAVAVVSVVARALGNTLARIGLQ